MYLCKICGWLYSGKYCPRCGNLNSSVSSIVTTFTHDETDEDRVAAARKALWDAMHASSTDRERCLECASLLRMYAPEDYYANFVEVIFSDDEDFMNKFLAQSFTTDIEKYADVVLDYVCLHLTLGLCQSVRKYLARANLEDASKYETLVAKYETAESVREDSASYTRETEYGEADADYGYEEEYWDDDESIETENLEIRIPDDSDIDGDVVAGIGYCKDSCIIVPYLNYSSRVVMIADRAFDITRRNGFGRGVPKDEKAGYPCVDSCMKLDSIDITYAYVKTIGDYAFRGCASLTEVGISHEVESIGEGAFDGCRSLANVYYDGKQAGWEKISIGINNGPLLNATLYYHSQNKPTTEGNYWYYDKYGYIKAWDNGHCAKKTDTAPKAQSAVYKTSTGLDFKLYGSRYGVTGTGLCKDSDIFIPSEYDGQTVIYVTYEAFSGQRHIESVHVPGTVASIGFSAFRDCTNLKRVTLDTGVTIIAEDAFSGCTSLTSVKIPSSVTTIGERAFEGCVALELVVVPNSVATIGNRAFFGCKSVRLVSVPEGVASIGREIFTGCLSLKSVTIPSSVTEIGERAFDGCSSLESIIIPDSVNSIGNYAFSDCASLKSVTIPFSVAMILDHSFIFTSIGAHAFSGCKSLTDVYYSGSQSDWEKISIGEGNNELTNATIHFNCIK